MKLHRTGQEAVDRATKIGYAGASYVCPVYSLSDSTENGRDDALLDTSHGEPSKTCQPSNPLGRSGLFIQDSHQQWQGLRMGGMVINTESTPLEGGGIS